MSVEIANLTADEYHALRPHLSSGFMRTVAESGPLVAYHRYIACDEPPKEDTDWMRLGSAFHAAMEDPEAFWANVVEVPDMVPDTFRPDLIKSADQRLIAERGSGDSVPYTGKIPRHQLYRDEFFAAAYESGEAVLTKAEADAQKAMIDSVWDNLAARKILESPHHKEAPVLGTCGETELPIKALCDILTDDAVWDFKTTQHSTPRMFIRDCWRKGYFHQAAHYLETTGRGTFGFIAVRNVFPFETMVYRVAKGTISKCREENWLIRQTIWACMEDNSWHLPGWGDQVEIGGKEDV